MKRLLVIAAGLAIATPAFAGLGLDGRYDYVSGNSNSQYSSTSYGTSAFLFNRLKLVGDTNLGDDLTVKLGINLLAFGKDTNSSIGSTGTGPTDSTNSNYGGKLSQINPSANGAGLNGLTATGPTDFVDYAEAVQKLAWGLSARFGKLSDQGFGGFESTENLGDMYFASQAYVGQTYLTGGGLVYKITDSQQAEVYVLNNTALVDNTRMGYNFVYRGTFGDFGVMANYGSLPYGNQTGTSNAINSTQAAVGLRYRLTDWTFIADYDMNTNFGNTFWNQDYAYVNANGGAALATGYSGLAYGTNHNTQQNTAVLQAKYKWGNWTPAAKLELTNRTGYQTSGTSDASDTITNWSLAAEYAKEKSNFKYYVAYVNSTTSYDSGAKYNTVINPGNTSVAFNAAGTGFNNNVAAQYAFAGIRYNGDLLK